MSGYSPFARQPGESLVRDQPRPAGVVNPRSLPIPCSPSLSAEERQQCERLVASREGCYADESLRDCRQRRATEQTEARETAEQAETRRREHLASVVNAGLDATRSILTSLSEAEANRLRVLAESIQQDLTLEAAKRASVGRANVGNWIEEADGSSFDDRIQELLARVLELQRAAVSSPSRRSPSPASPQEPVEEPREPETPETPPLSLSDLAVPAGVVATGLLLATGLWVLRRRRHTSTL